MSDHSNLMDSPNSRYLFGSGLSPQFGVQNRPFGYPIRSDFASFPRKVFQAQSWNPNSYQKVGLTDDDDDDDDAYDEPPCKLKKHQKKKKCQKEKTKEVVVYKIVEERYLKLEQKKTYSSYYV